MQSSHIATAAETPLCHLAAPVIAAATKWLASREFEHVSNLAVALVSQLGEPEVNSGGGKGKDSSGAPPARPTTGLLAAIALVLRAVPGALNPPRASDKMMVGRCSVTPI